MPEFRLHINRWYWGTGIYLITIDAKGFLQMSIEKERPTMACIETVSVTEDDRQRGIGRRLMKYAEVLAEEMGINQLWLLAEKDSWVQRWYEELGYKVYDDNPKGYDGKLVAMDKIID